MPKSKPSDGDRFAQKLLRYIAKERRAWYRIRVNHPNEDCDRAIYVLADVANKIRALRGTK